MNRTVYPNPGGDRYGRQGILEAISGDGRTGVIYDVHSSIKIGGKLCI